MTLFLEEAAKYLGLHPATLQERAKRGKIPGASKPGKRWVFRQSGLDAYLDQHSPCRSTALETYGISTSNRHEDGLEGIPRTYKV
jgi:excisionase family DNA binding protein